MADKFLNMALSSGIVTPLKISDVATIVAGADVGAGNTLQVQFLVTYANGGVATLLSQVRGAANAVFLPSTDAQKTAFVRALWEQVIKGVATPWNLPIIGGASGFDMTTSPATPQAVTGTLASKSSTQLLGTGSTAGAAGIRAVSPFLSIA